MQLTEYDLSLLREQHIAWEIEEFEQWQYEESSLDRVPWDWKGYAVYGVALAGGLAFWWWMAVSIYRAIHG